MENETIFRFLLPVLLFSFIFHRGLQGRRRSPEQKRISAKLDAKTNNAAVGALGAIALCSSLAYAILPAWVNWAALPMPLCLRWLGVPLAVLGFALLEWAQAALGTNWSDTPVKLKEHTLTVTGPYRWLRHPIYTGFLLILSVPLFLSANWLIGISWLASTYLDVNARIDAEEEMLAKTFGAVFEEHKKKTGRLLPRISR